MSLPSSLPTSQPTVQPSQQPITQPTEQPSGLPSMQPSTLPSATPSSHPSVQRTDCPTCQPSYQPSLMPSQHLSSLPTVLNTSYPAQQGEWCTAIDPYITSVGVKATNNAIWVCGSSNASLAASICTTMNSELDTQITQYRFPWAAVATVLQAESVSKVIISGRTMNSSPDVIATCDVETDKLTCTAKYFEDTSFTDGAYVPFVQKLVYVGKTNTMYPTVFVVDPTSGTVNSYIVSSTMMSSISLLRVLSPPVFIGGFVAGTCVSHANANYIYAGMVRTDYNVLSAMYIASKSGTILNNAELVNAMALEYEHPNSFIAGGLQLSDGTGLHAYLLCINSLYRRVIYGMRYIRQDAAINERRMLRGSVISTSVVIGIVRMDAFLFLVVNINSATLFGSKGSVSVLKVAMETGGLLKQVQIYSSNSSIQCLDVAAIGSALVLACNVVKEYNTSQAYVLSVDKDLSFSVLPPEHFKSEATLFLAEAIPFIGTLLPLTVRSGDVKTADYMFTTEDGHPTIQPSMAPTRTPTSQPSSAPSGQPSSSPTAAPSVSPQPTSQPSSSGPTNTYKPTVKPTQQPTSPPTVSPTVPPTLKPSVYPTARPSPAPSTQPSPKPSPLPSSYKPTVVPSTKPSRNPTVSSTTTPTIPPSASATVIVSSQALGMSSEATILGYTVAGLLGLCFLYQLWRWCTYQMGKVREDEVLVRQMTEMKLPAKQRYPIFRATTGLCCPIIPNYDAAEGNTRDRNSTAITAHSLCETVHVVESASTIVATSDVSLAARRQPSGDNHDVNNINLVGHQKSSEPADTLATGTMAIKDNLSDLSNDNDYDNESASESHALSEEETAASEDSFQSEKLSQGWSNHSDSVLSSRVSEREDRSAEADSAPFEESPHYLESSYHSSSEKETSSCENDILYASTSFSNVPSCGSGSDDGDYMLGTYSNEGSVVDGEDSLTNIDYCTP